MILCIHQPSYFPWLGLLAKIKASDAYLLLDEVQLSDSAYQHRNLFMIAGGRTRFLTIPFARDGYRRVPFRELAIADDGWRSKHLNFIRNNYRWHPYFREVMPDVEAFLSTHYASLLDAVLASMRLSFRWFGVKARTIMQSELSYDRKLTKGDLVVALVRATGADTYLSGRGASSYLNEAFFGARHKLLYQDFVHPRYSQFGVTEFVPGLACLDVLFNVGPEEAHTLLSLAGP